MCLADFGALYTVAYYDADNVDDTIPCTEIETSNSHITLTDNYR